MVLSALRPLNSFMSKGPLRISVVLSLALLMACDQRPTCNFSEVEDSAPSAGCMVLWEGKLLLMQGQGGGFSPPGGSVDSGESAQCAAERETWEETGIEVRASSMVREFANGFRLYSCEPVQTSPEVKISRPWEVHGADFYTPEQFIDLNWRFPDQGLLMAEMVRERRSSMIKGARSE